MKRLSLTSWIFIGMAAGVALGVIRVVSRDPGESVFLTIDGQIGTPVREHDTVICRSSQYSLHLIRPPHMMFFDVLRQKLKWGER